MQAYRNWADVNWSLKWFTIVGIQIAILFLILLIILNIAPDQNVKMDEVWVYF